MMGIREKLQDTTEKEYEMKVIGSISSLDSTPIKPVEEKDPISTLIYLSILFLAIGVKVLQPLAIAQAKDSDGKYNFNESTMVLLTELAKLIFCGGVFAYQYQQTDILKRDSLHNLSFRQSIHFLVPSVLYATSNTLVFFGMSYINPALFHVFGNIRILIAALLYRVMMKRKQTDIQWLGLCLIAAGAILARPNEDNKNQKESGNENYFLGFVLVSLMSLCSTCASIYTEKYYKKTQDLSIFYQNIVLYIYGIIVNFLFICIREFFNNDDSLPSAFDGFTEYETLLVLLCQSAMGISLSFIFKFLDNIVYVISLTVSMFITAFLSSILFDFEITLSFISAMLVVTIAIYLYYRNKVFEKYKLEEKHTLF